MVIRVGPVSQGDQCMSIAGQSSPRQIILSVNAQIQITPQTCPHDFSPVGRIGSKVAVLDQLKKTTSSAWSSPNRDSHNRGRSYAQSDNLDSLGVTTHPYQ